MMVGQLGSSVFYLKCCTSEAVQEKVKFITPIYIYALKNKLDIQQGDASKETMLCIHENSHFACKDRKRRLSLTHENTMAGMRIILRLWILL